jgi:hypothetical protein
MFFRYVAPGRSVGFSVACVVPMCRQSHEFSQFPARAFPRSGNDVGIGGMLRAGVSRGDSGNG